MAALCGTSASVAAADSPPDITGNWAVPWKSDNVDPALLVPDGPAPQFTPQYADKARAITALREAVQSEKGAGSKNADSEHVQREISCLPYGMPTMMAGGYSIEILAGRDHYTIVAEAMLEVRRIYMNRPQRPLDEVDPGYQGYSVGKWEGDTLVVNTIGVKANVLGHGNMPHSEQMVLTERIRLVRPNILQNSFTITDPVALLRPYQFTYTLKRLDNYETPEFVCDNPREKIDSEGKLNVDLKTSK